MVERARVPWWRSRRRPGSSASTATPPTAPPSSRCAAHGVTARRNGAGRRARGVRLPTRRRHPQLADENASSRREPSGGRHGEAAVGPPGRRRHRGGIERGASHLSRREQRGARAFGSVLAPPSSPASTARWPRSGKRGSAPAGRSVTAGRERRMASGWPTSAAEPQAEGSGAASSTTRCGAAWHRGGRDDGEDCGVRLGPFRSVRRTRPRSQRHVPCLRRGSSSCLVASISRLRPGPCACLPVDHVVDIAPLGGDVRVGVALVYSSTSSAVGRRGVGLASSRR